MAVEGLEETVALRKRKRKRSLSQRKLLDHERVEVRSEEDGFEGSWHSGVVIACGKAGFWNVKYDNVLVDDGSANVVDVVYVSPVLDGIDIGCVNESNCRGLIRPLPPLYNFGNCDLHYGLCVDVYHLEAWWEGVVFDHEDGLKERYIFFPDIGDGMEAGTERLRITQDWNEVTENWKKRGNWIFLELIEQYEQEKYLPVSVKQIWYDVRGKEGFKKLREWTSPVKDLWKELVLEVINDNISIIVRELCQAPEILSKLKSSQPVTDVNMDSKAESIHCSASLPADSLLNSLLNSEMVIDNEAIVEDFLDCNARITNELHEIVDLVAFPRPLAMEPNKDQLSFMGKNDGSSNLLTDPDVPDQHKAICVQPQDLFMSPSKHDGTSTTGSVFHSESIPHNDANQTNEKSKRSTCECATKWLPVTSEMLPGVQFCPDAVDRYYEHYCTGKPYTLTSKTSAVKDVRKHLICLGWKFEYMSKKGVLRWRYTSPDGKCLYSLRQVCKYLKESARDLLSSISQDIHRSPHASSDDCFLSLPTQPQESQPHASSDDSILSLPGQLQESQPHYLSDDCFLSMGRPEKSWPQTVVSPHSNAVGVTEYFPQEIVEYSQLRYHKRSKKMRNMIVKVKEHLSALGWKFSHSNTRGKDEWCYKSPTGKDYFSLRAACKGCLDEQVLVNAKVKDKELQWKRNDHSLDDEHHICSAQTHIDARKGFLKNDLKGNTKLSHPKEQHPSQLKLKRGRGFIKLRGGLDGSQSARVLRSSKCVQEVVFPTSSYHNPRTMLSWLIDNEVVLPREKVYYVSRKNRHIMAEGRITRDGIKCSCCTKVFTLSGFEVHAGSTYHRPAANIYLENGQSLIDCQRKIIGDRKTENFRTELCDRMKGNWRQGENDYICSVCHYGGELVLCDQCPSSFHKSCIGLTDIPDGDWFCPPCCCRFCMERIFQNNIDDAIGKSVTCGQCGHNYHIRCLRNKCTAKLESFRQGNWFCSKECKKISSGLQKLLGKPTAVGVDNLTWSILKPMNIDSHYTDVHHIDALMENDSKLNVALGLMHECFEPVKERRTGRDIIEDVIFCRESDLNRLNFRGFYTVLLERNDELITVATVRVYGQKVAEVPLVGTQFQYRRLGMCHILMNELEKKLMELGVERLVLPAVPSVLNAWTTSFGFSQMTDFERLQFLHYTFLEFQDTIMCQKLLMKTPSADSRQLKGIELKVNDEICGSGGNIDFDHSIAISEVFRADQIEDSGIVDQRQVKIPAGNKSDGNNSPTDMVPMVKQNQDLECRPCDSDTNPLSVCSMEDANFKRACGNNGVPVLKYYYKRRKKSAG